MVSAPEEQKIKDELISRIKELAREKVIEKVVNGKKFVITLRGLKIEKTSQGWRAKMPIKVELADGTTIDTEVMSGFTPYVVPPADVILSLVSEVEDKLKDLMRQLNTLIEALSYTQ